MRPFAATSLGIVDTYTNNIVIPNGTEIFIDKGLRKPDGSPITVRDLKYSTFADGFGEGSIGVAYDFEFISIPVIWFVVDGRDKEEVDASLDRIKEIINNAISDCLDFKQGHPEREGSVCPPYQN